MGFFDYIKRIGSAAKEVISDPRDQDNKNNLFETVLGLDQVEWLKPTDIDYDKLEDDEPEVDKEAKRIQEAKFYIWMDEHPEKRDKILNRILPDLCCCPHSDDEDHDYTTCDSEECGRVRNRLDKIMESLFPIVTCKDI